ncbi:hypothetical protein RB195_025236 [Necator americanus]|uniref:SAM domain-containing protein n=1 Tax=Necator americanus TaxID=51031 RepID=A0ABR1ERH9_NECAM
MDGFAEANLLLNSALAQLDEIIINGSKCRGPSSENGSPQPCKAEPWTAENMRRDIDEELDLESTTAHDVEDDRSTKASDWSSKGSDASSGVESPPSDVPTSSSSLCNPPKIYSEFLKAIEEQTLTEKPDAETQLKIIQWLTGSCSSSPSMSTVSCPEYPEMQEKVHRLAMARDSLSLQVSVLNEQVGAQKEKIRDLEALLALKRNSLNSTEELLQDKYHYMGDCTELESKRLNLMEEVSSLKLKYATLEQQRNETEKMLKLSQNEMDHVNQSMNSMVVQKQLRSQTSSGNRQPSQLPTVKGSQGSKENEEMEQLRSTVQRLIADNEQKNHQISSLRNALDEQLRTRSHRDGYYPVSRWNEQPPYDLNTQIRLLLLEEPLEPMTHSTSFPLRLCSSTHHRDAIQPSSSFTSSRSTVSSYHSLLQTGNGHLYPSIVGTRSEQSYRSPSSPAARQLAAELDELRRISNEPHGNQPHSSTSLPRRMGNKASSTLALPTKKHSLTSGTSAVESDDEVARGVVRNTVASSRNSSDAKPVKRDRMRSSLRNLFSKLTRSTSQEQTSSVFGRKNAARSSSSARHPASALSGGAELFPSLSRFVDWKSEKLADWIGKVGFAQYVPEIAKNVRSGQHLLNMNSREYESILGMKSALHRKRLNLLLRRIEGDVAGPARSWDVQQTQKWLEDIGLPQYKDVFSENLVDGLMLLSLNAADLVEMRVVNAHHFMCISRSIQYMKMVDFKHDRMIRKFNESMISSYPRPEAVVNWTHSATCEWLQKIDLDEFTPNLLCAGTPGALMVYEPTFTAETLAEILQMPPHKTLLRRHLTTHFNQLLGQKIVAEKRDFLATGTHPQLLPGVRIKILKKGLSIPRKKTKTEFYLEPDELLCPPILKLKYPTMSQSDIFT